MPHKSKPDTRRAETADPKGRSPASDDAQKTARPKPYGNLDARGTPKGGDRNRKPGA